MKKRASAFLLSAALTVLALEPRKGSALSGMVETERSFAQASSAVGRRAAFAANLAENCVMYTDKWITNGKRFSEEQPDRPTVLKWEPEFADISAAGDMGVTTGPWELQEYRPGTDPLYEGYFLTVWKKQADGSWKAVLDAGTVSPVAPGYGHALAFPEGADKTTGTLLNDEAEEVRQKLPELETLFFSAYSKAPSPALYSSYFAPDGRAVHAGLPPARSAREVEKTLSGLDKILSWRTEGSGAASSGDIGYTYGTFESPGNGKSPSGFFVRVWKKQADGNFKIVIEMLG